jgi:hypothetical protein
MTGFFADPLGGIEGIYGNTPKVKPSGLLSGLPAVKPPKELTDYKPIVPVKPVPPPEAEGKEVERPDPEGKTPANKDDVSNLRPHGQAPATFSTDAPGVQPPASSLYPSSGAQQPPTGGWPGAVTADLAVRSGFPKETAADWASLANYITKGEHKSQGTGAFTELYNGKPWEGANTNHPYVLGWQGDRGPTGDRTTAYGYFQDEVDTWTKTIVPQFLNGDTRMTPENQVKGNLLLAAQAYKTHTGHDLLADFKAGQFASIDNVLHSLWPTLGQGSAGQARSDEAFANMQRTNQEAIDAGRVRMTELEKIIRASDPASEEMHKRLHEAMDESDRLAKQYQQLSTKMPTSRTPMEAASGITPLLTFLVAMGGFATRRPGLGAINAMSGALQGLKEGNDAQFANNVDLWKTQTNMAHTAFEMQNQGIQNIVQDMTLTDAEKQHKLTDYFRLWQMDQDLRLAQSNQWKEVYERIEKNDLTQLRREELRLKYQRDMDGFVEDAQDKKDGSYGMTGNAKVYYKNLYRNKQAEVGGRDLNDAEKLELQRQAATFSRTVQGGLTTPQQEMNDQIDAAREDLDADHWPKSFRRDVALGRAAPDGALDEAALKAKGYTDDQIKLYNALVKPGSDVARNAQLIKQYETATKPKNRGRQYVVGEQTPTGPAAGQQAEPRDAQELADKIVEGRDGGVSRETAKAYFAKYAARFGLSEDDFDAVWPEETGTTSGPVAAPASSYLPGDAPAGGDYGGMPLGLAPQVGR